jgi:hypothetical protein
MYCSLRQPNLRADRRAGICCVPYFRASPVSILKISFLFFWSCFIDITNRKNWMFANAPRGVWASVIIYSLYVRVDIISAFSYTEKALKIGPLVKRSKTPPFHGGYTGSNPVRVTKQNIGMISSAVECLTSRVSAVRTRHRPPK